ncbi:transposase DDE domain protein [Brucella grignonensis]|uniref:Transposase DDE domain protein n=1 Tax=Brucella grignonensis TaxID=94627 RepID=A0A256EZA7_9HYPH|nr:transposase DDE domain protein [Brucella grignonensis]
MWDRLPKAVSAVYAGDIVMIDSTCVRVHQHGATGKKWIPAIVGMGRSRGDLTSRNRAIIDAEGRPINLCLTDGQIADCSQAEYLMECIKEGGTLLADKAYDTDAIRMTAADRKIWANIPSKSNRKGRLRVLTMGVSPEKSRRALL